MEIIIGCSKNTKIGSKLIQWWMGTDYSHVYVKWRLRTQDRSIVYHASHGMVHFISEENFKLKNQVVKEYELNIGQRHFIEFSKHCVDLAGQEYSTLELGQILLNNLTDGRYKAEDLPGYICSELMAELLENFFKAKFDKPRYLLTPKDIILFLERGLRG